jgi:isopentenyl phosphate kinase
MNKLILIKLGGSLITNKNQPESPNLSVIKKLSQEINELINDKDKFFVIGHGSGSFAHVPAKQYETKKGFINEKSPFGMGLVQDSAAKLNRIVVKHLLESEINAYSINPSSALLTKNGKIVNWYLEPLKLLLKNKMIPVVYGDVVVDENQGCAIISTEVLLNYLALNLQKEYEIEKIIYLGCTDGAWDENQKTIPVITSKSYSSLQKHFGASGGIDVTGGMDHKMSEAMEIAKVGIHVVIANGNMPHILKKILNKEYSNCTIITK